MLRSPSHAVIGTTDAAPLAAFLGRLGFAAAGEHDLDAAAALALYGLAAPTTQTLLLADGRPGGALRLVATPHAAPTPSPFDRGPLVLDVYTTDIEAVRDRAVDGGATAGHLGTIELGPLVMRQVALTGPDGLRVVLVEANHRRPSLLDDDGVGRDTSELHSVLWSVDDIDAAAPFWTDEAGLTQAHVFPVGLPVVSRIMGLPGEQHDLRMNLLVDAEQCPVRIELFEFSGDPGGDRPTWPLQAGLHAIAFEVDDLDAATAGLAGAAFGTPVPVAAQRAVTGVAPGGVRFELWENP